MSKGSKPVKGKIFPTILPEIRSLIEMSRHHAAVTANLALVNLYWNIGRIITQDIQKNEKRAGYGEQLVESLAKLLTQGYGRGYSVSNLNDMRRFYEDFQILQALPVKSSETKIRQSLSAKSTDTQVLQALPVESSNTGIRQAMPAESSGRILIDFRKHFHLGWSETLGTFVQSVPRRKIEAQTSTSLLVPMGLGRRPLPVNFSRIMRNA